MAVSRRARRPEATGLGGEKPAPSPQAGREEGREGTGAAPLPAPPPRCRVRRRASPAPEVDGCCLPEVEETFCLPSRASPPLGDASPLSAPGSGGLPPGEGRAAAAEGGRLLGRRSRCEARPETAEAAVTGGEEGEGSGGFRHLFLLLVVVLLLSRERFPRTSRLKAASVCACMSVKKKKHPPENTVIFAER